MKAVLATHLSIVILRLYHHFNQAHNNKLAVVNTKVSSNILLGMSNDVDLVISKQLNNFTKHWAIAMISSLLQNTLHEEVEKVTS